MTINIFVLKGDLNGENQVVRFFFCWVYIELLVVLEDIQLITYCIILYIGVGDF